MRPEAIGVFWIREADYWRFRKACVDRDQMPPMHQQWLRQAEQRLRAYEQAHGVTLQRIEVDLDEFLAWCKAHGRKVDANARLAYTSIETMRRNTERH